MSIYCTKVYNDHKHLKPIGDRLPVIVKTILAPPFNDQSHYGCQYWTEDEMKKGFSDNSDGSVSYFILKIAGNTSNQFPAVPKLITDQQQDCILNNGQKEN